MKIRKEYTCPLEIVHDFVKGKWKTIIIFQLGKGNMTLSSIEHSIEGISQNVGIEYMIEQGQSDILEKKGICMHV